MSRLFYLAIMMLLIVSQNTAQENYIPDMQHFSPPNVASFNKFEDIPVSYYTGNPDISIPVYTIQDEQINIPIVLRYHGSGIKVEEEASWVGLGWNLNVGGSVTCRVNGKMDEVWYDTDTTSVIMQLAQDITSFTTFSSASPLILYRNEVGWDPVSSPADYYSKYGTYEVSDQWSSEGFQYKGVAMMYGYYKPDIYSYTLPNYSGKFYINHARGKAYSINESVPMHINIEDEDWKLIITDGSGVKYFFNTPQRRKSDYGDVREREIPNTYYLDKIQYPNNQIVLFEYEEKEMILSNNSVGGTNYIKMIDGYYDWPHLCIYPGYSYNTDNFIGEHYYPTYLKRIVTDNAIVEFKLSENPRSDLPGEHCLEKIIVSNLANDTIKEFSFNYEYFRNTITGSEERMYKRLKLNSFNDGQDGVYSFDYNRTIDLPSKRSFQRDYWGYFNNSGGASTFLPDLEKFFSNNNPPSWMIGINSSTAPIPKRNRAPRAEFMKAGMIERMHYPTGGYIEFNFEPHTFSNYYYEKYDATDLRVREEANDNGVRVFTVDKKLDLMVYASMGIAPVTDEERENPIILIDLMLGSYVEFYEDNVLIKRYDANVNSPGMSGSFNHTFMPGKEYKFISHKAQAAVDHGSAGVNIHIMYYLKDKWSFGGGLRIKEIKAFSKANELTRHKVYTYEDNDFSYGKLMSQLNFANKEVLGCLFDPGVGEPLGVFEKTDFDYIEINSSSNIAISNSANGSPVGYTKVVEKTLGQEENGSIIYYYHNEPNLYQIPIFPEIVDLQNGQLNKMKILDRRSLVVESTSYNYQAIVQKGYYGFAGNTHNYSLTKGFLSEQFTNLIYAIPASVYKPVEIVKKSYFYKPSGTVDSVTVYVVQEYNTRNLQVSRTITTNSKGEIIITKNKYPLDYELGIGHPITDLTSRRILLPIIEQQTWKDDDLVAGKLTEYDNFLGNILPYQIYSIETHELGNFGQNINDEAPYNTFKPIGIPYEPKVKIDYGIFGKLKGHKKTNDLSTYYLWGYNKQYPVAKIQTFDSTLNVNSMQTCIDNLAISNSDDITSINGNITKLKSCLSSLNNQDYVVSYYTYKPLVGLTSETDLNGLTTYYAYDEFGRLVYIKDNEYKILKKHIYNYKRK